ncbi:MAG TPA: hypothetical protein VEO95_10350 [Chthoniobacteraceae bacterium]|nr:hypothetical protein [Chthoniobacteraceae bacterium]
MNTRHVTLPLPELIGIAATRGMLGAGVALLLSDCLDRDQRRALGVVLLAVGAFSTVPFAWDIFHHRIEPPLAE